MLDSEAGLAFTAKYADYNFCLGKELNMPRAVAAITARVQAVSKPAGRPIASYALFMVIADATDDAAMAKWNCYTDGADTEALEWMV